MAGTPTDKYVRFDPERFRLCRIHQNNGVTHEKLAERAKVSKRTIENAEHGERLQWSGAEQIAKAIGVTIQSLTTGGSALQADGNAKRPASAVEQIRQIVQKGESLRFAIGGVSAHNLDTIHLVDLVAAGYETDIENIVECAGGSAANTVYALAKLGLTTAIAGVIRDDECGRFLAEDLRSAAVDIECLLVAAADHAKPTGKNLIFTDLSGERSMYARPGINSAWCELLAENPAERRKVVKMLSESQILHLSSFAGRAEQDFCALLVSHMNTGGLLSFVPGSLYSKQGMDSLSPFLSRCNLLFVYESQLDAMLKSSNVRMDQDADARSKAKAVFEWKQQHGSEQPLILSIKRKSEKSHRPLSEHSFLVCTGVHGIQETFSVRNSGMTFTAPRVDTTGSQDAFAAGLIFGLLNGYSLQLCADAGYFVAASASLAIGPRRLLPTRSALDGAFRKLSII